MLAILNTKLGAIGMNRITSVALLLAALALCGCSSKPEPQIVLIDDAECKALADTPQEAFEACQDARENYNANLKYRANRVTR